MRVRTNRLMYLWAMLIGLGLIFVFGLSSETASPSALAQTEASDTDTDTAKRDAPLLTETPTPGPTCGPDAQYGIVQSEGASIDAGTTFVVGSDCDQCTQSISLPFTYYLYGQPYTSAIAGDNGTLAFSANGNDYSNICLPRATFNNAIMAHWDNLDMRPATGAGLGIYTSVSGASPNRIFNVEWRACRYGGGACAGNVNFEVRLYESQSRFDIVYGEVSNNGGSATIGLQRGTGSQLTQYACNTANSVVSGRMLAFSQPQCATSTPTRTVTNTPTGTSTRTATYTPTGTSTSTATYTPTRTQTSTGTVTNTPTITNTPTATSTATDTSTPSSTVTGTPPTATNTVAATNTPAPPTNTPAPTNTPGGATPTPCAGGPIVVNGSIDANDPTQTGRLFRGGVASTCGVPNACSTLTGTYHYDLLGPYVNTSGSTVCITVQLDTACTGTNYIFSGAYVGPFDPANICNNNVGDAGSSPDPQAIYGFNVPAGATFYVNVAEVTADAGCSAYTVTITGFGGGCATPTTVAGPTNTPGGPTNTPIPTASPTVCGSNYTITSSTGATIVPATTFVTGSNCDDCVNTVALPFPFTLYGGTYTNINLDSNGTAQFNSSGSTFTNTCLPYTSANYAILPHWDDLLLTGTGQGIYTLLQGAAPNRTFYIEWIGGYFSGGGNVDIELVLHEGSTTFEVVYGTVDQTGTSATVGVQKDTGSLFQQYECNTGGLSVGQKLTFTLSSCGTATVGTPPVGTPTAAGTPTSIPTTTPAVPTATNTTISGTATPPPPTRTPTYTPTSTPSCGGDAPYATQTVTAPIQHGAFVDRSRCDDCVLGMQLPFQYRLYGQSYDTVYVTSNGQMQLFAGTPTTTPVADPIAFCDSEFLAPNIIMPFWDDLNTSVGPDCPNCGVYTLTTGIAPSRIFYVEWDACKYDKAFQQCTEPVHFEVQLFENQARFDVLYDGINGQELQTTVGVRGYTADHYTILCEPALTTGLSFRQPQCAVTPTPTACTIQFSDVPVGSTFYPFIRCLACYGIISGYPDNTFRPGNNVTRGQLAKIVSNAAGLSGTPSGQSFEDVPPSSTFYLFIERLYALGAIGGYPCGGPGEPCGVGNLPYYRPGANVTRGQLTKIVSNAVGFTDPAPPTYTFTDVPVGSTFHVFVERLLLNRPGVMGGYPCGGPGEPCDPQNRPYFRPGNNLTRGQASKIVANTFFHGCNPPSRK